MNARYYNGMIGRFLSQDRVFLSIGNEQEIKAQTNQKLQELLTDPQSLNSYSYARNNPIRLVDPNGEWFWDVVSGRQSWNDFSVEVGQAAQYLYDNNSVWRATQDNPAAASIIIGTGGGLAAFGGAAVATAASTAYLGGAGTACVAFCGQAVQQGQRAIDYTARYGPGLGSSMNQVAKNLEGTLYKFTDHSIQRIAQKVGVGNEKSVLNVLQNSKPFEYFHDGVQKLGYYDSSTKLFVGQVKDSGNITTVITNAGKNYINNLLKK